MFWDKIEYANSFFTIITIWLINFEYSAMEEDEVEEVEEEEEEA